MYALIKEEGSSRHAAPATKSNRSTMHTSPVSVTGVDGITLQRQPHCACGGDCLTCRNQPQLQARLAVSVPGDHFEQEADRIAGQVMTSAPSLQDGQNQEALQRKTGQVSETVGASVSDSYVQELGSGQPLDAATRAFVEPRFGRDFSEVRVHTDAKAAESARAVNALAYTVGRNIVFGAGQYAPGMPTGRHLLSHELTHVVQQANASHLTRPPHIADSDPHEHKAEQTARAMGAGWTASVALQATGYRLARFSDTGHHVVEEAGLAGAGFSETQIKAVEQGNIHRDYSQLPPGLNVALLCQHERFGGYHAPEHFDNFIFDAVTDRWRSRGTGLGIGMKSFAHPDPQTPDRTSIDYIESELTTLANVGMTNSSLEHLGNAFHAVEDFFAHSNFVELINNKGLGNQTLLTGSVPGTESTSIAHELADLSASPMREYYERQAEAATAKTEPYSHARMAHDTPSSPNYEQARRLAALVIQDLGKEVLVAMSQPQADMRVKWMNDNVLVKIRRYLRPPNPNDRWWEQLTTLDKGAIDDRLKEAASRTPVTVNQCDISPLRNLDASRYSSWKMPIGVAQPVQVGGNIMWLQAGVGVTPVLSDRPLSQETSGRESSGGAGIIGVQITGVYWK